MCRTIRYHTQINTNNVNKICALLQITGGIDECMIQKFDIEVNGRITYSKMEFYSGKRLASRHMYICVALMYTRSRKMKAYCKVVCKNKLFCIFSFLVSQYRNTVFKKLANNRNSRDVHDKNREGKER
jgi:hypothetical protein